MRLPFKMRLVALVLALVVGCGPGGQADTEYQRGYNFGIKVVSEARKLDENRKLDVPVRNIADWPADKDKSADWNAGFRAGVAHELNQP